MQAPLFLFAADESGVTAIEYSLIAGLISVVIIGALTPVGAALNAVYAGIYRGLAAKKELRCFANNCRQHFACRRRILVLQKPCRARIRQAVWRARPTNLAPTWRPLRHITLYAASLPERRRTNSLGTSKSCEVLARTPGLTRP